MGKKNRRETHPPLTSPIVPRALIILFLSAGAFVEERAKLPSKKKKKTLLSILMMKLVRLYSYHAI